MCVCMRACVCLSVFLSFSLPISPPLCVVPEPSRAKRPPWHPPPSRDQSHAACAPIQGAKERMSKLRSTKTTATKRGGWNTQREAAAGGESKSSSNVALDEAVDNHAGAIATIREDIQQSVKQRIHEVKHFLCAQLLRQHLGQVVHHREQRLRLVALRALLQLSNGLCSDTATKIPNKNKQGNSEVSLVSIQQVVQAPFLNHTAKTRQIRQTDRQTGGQMDTHTHTHARVRTHTRMHTCEHKCAHMHTCMPSAAVSNPGRLSVLLHQSAAGREGVFGGRGQTV